MTHVDPMTEALNDRGQVGVVTRTGAWLQLFVARRRAFPCRSAMAPTRDPAQLGKGSCHENSLAVAGGARHSGHADAMAVDLAGSLVAARLALGDGTELKRRAEPSWEAGRLRFPHLAVAT